MQQRRTFVLLLGLAALAGLWAACRPIQPREEGASAALPKIELVKPEDNADVTVEDGRLVIDIQSAGGIGGATITWAPAPSAAPAAAPAAPPILRLHLGGLEELRLALGGETGGGETGGGETGGGETGGGETGGGETGGVETIVSVASTLPHTVRQSTRSGGEGELQPLAEGDPAWLDVAWFPEGETAAFPLADGYFDVTLADTRLTQAGAEVQVQWIAFYR